jgi:NAD(P)-dependent dehydrogenase (short-subunit alcohol dehydrogenase family)
MPILADLMRSARAIDSGPAALRPVHGGLAGKVAVVTGGDSPLARAAALCLAHNGADVVLAYHDEHGGVQEALRRIHVQGGNAQALSGELGDPGFARRVADAALAQLEQSEALFDDDATHDPTRLQRPERALPQGSSAIATFGHVLREALAAQGVRVRAMTRGPVWTPLVPADPDTELPVNQHFGNTGPCFVFVAKRT